MTTSADQTKPTSQSSSSAAARQPFRPQTTTLILLGIVLLSGAIVAGWFTGQGTISRIFTQLNALQNQPPL